MRVLNKIGKRKYLCRYKTAIRIQACIFMSLFLVSCVDGAEFPDFSLLNKKSTNGTVKPELSDIKKGGGTNNVAVFAPVKKVKTESLLDAKGSWNLVEKSEAIDPMQAHLMARKKVNTKRRKYNKDLSPHFEPDAKSGKDGKMRVVRLEPNENSLDEFEVAESSITKPEHAVVEGDILQKIKALFGENDVDSQSYATVVPKRKPSPRIRVVDSKVKDTNKGWNFFSRDKKVKQKNSGKQGVSDNVVKLKPKSSEERMVGGIVLPPELSDRRKVNSVVVRKTENVNAINEDAVLAAVEDVKEPLDVYSEGVVIPKRKPTNVSKFSASAINKIISNPSNQKKKRGDISSGNKGSIASVIRLRSGKHPGKTRLVIEVTRTTKYKVIVDHIRNVLRIKLDNTSWKISPQESFKKSNLLGTYIARGQRDGSTILEVRLKKKTKILDTMILRPNLSSKHRVVIDLKD